MNTYTLTSNSKLNHNGIIVEAHDMAEARQRAKDFILEGFKVDAVLTATGDIHPLSVNSPKALNLINNATVICTIAGHRLYESPTHGDESPLLTIKDGKAKLTSFWEAPDVEDFLQKFATL